MTAKPNKEPRKGPSKAQRSGSSSSGNAPTSRNSKHSGVSSRSPLVQPTSPSARPSAQKKASPKKPYADNNVGDSKEADDIRQRTSLSLAGHPLPPLAALVDTLVQFRNLQRLDLSSLAPSESNPKGLTRLDWLAKAVFRTQQDLEPKDKAKATKAFGDSLTWLNVSNSAELTSEGCVGLEALEQLHVLTMSSCKLKTFPISINPLKNLRALVLNNNLITELPGSFPYLPQLNSLILSHNMLTELPASLPASLPALKKLSVGHNQLTGSTSLPDFSVCLSLRDVRINNNPGIGALPSHVSIWGKGANGNVAPGLELLELKDCGLNSWESLSTLVPSGKNPQPHGRKGLTQLLLKGNGIAQLEGYKDFVLNAHPTIRVLDNERLHPREKLTSEQKEPSPSKEKISRMARPAAEVRNARDRAAGDAQAEESAEANSDAQEDSEFDDEEAAQMAAEMRAMRKGRDSPAFEKKRASSRPQKTNPEPSEKEEIMNRPKHKRGARSSKKGQDPKHPESLDVAGKLQSALQSLKGQSDTSAAEPFFEAVNLETERLRLAPMHQQKRQQAKISSNRTMLAEGVLEDVKEPALGKSRRLESKSIQELEMTDGADHSPIASASRKSKKSTDVEQAQSTPQHSSSVASIVDLRAKSRKRSSDTIAQESIGAKKTRSEERPPAKLPFFGTKVEGADHIGAGANAWGV